MDWLAKLRYLPVSIPSDDLFEDKVNIGDNPVLYHIIEVILILVITEITYRLIERPMSKISWDKTKQYFARIFNLETRDYFKKCQAALAALILILGSAAIAISPRVKAEDFNKSQLAQRINQNSKKQKTDNAKLIKKLKKEKKKKREEI